MPILLPDQIATGRSTSLFVRDMNANRNALDDTLKGKRVCVIGGAGSIGAATIEVMLDFPIKDLVVIDHNENALASLTRRIHAASSTPNVSSILTLPLDFSGSIAGSFFKETDPFDFVLNFAALKHVRSEKNAFSALALLETNVLKHLIFLKTLKKSHVSANYFSVSTDKAANPVSFMGASKRLMEHVIFGSEASLRLSGKVTSARFANVAYSAGSLLESFATRLHEDSPLAAPEGIERYFLSHKEAGELCLLAAILGEDCQIYIPSLLPDEHLIPMQTVAERFLEANGYRPVIYIDAERAKADLDDLKRTGQWPLVITPGNTAGEKPYEEFVGLGETAFSSEFSKLHKIPYQSPTTDMDINTLCDELTNLIGQNATLSDLKHLISKMEPAFASAHMASDIKLDDRI